MEKTGATTAVVNERVAQRRAMRDGMAETQQGMIGHMMEHLQHESMKAEMASLDAKLDSLLTAMNTAKRGKKVGAMAAVINELAAQRKAMRDHMMAMGPQMLHHGCMGMAEGMAKSMSNCPMHSVPPQAGEQARHHCWPLPGLAPFGRRCPRRPRKRGAQPRSATRTKRA